MQETAPIVRFEHVTMQYPGVLANDDVSLDVLPGEVFALVGENGAGKTTLMNLLYGLYQPDEGEITFKGKRVSVMGTGMGMPSISIYVTELLRDYGVENAIRIGTCGSMNPDIHIKDIILAEGACTDSMINQSVFGGTYCPVSDFDLLRTAYKKSRALGIKTWVGNVLSSDNFYQESLVCEKANALWMKYGVMAAEMESAALLTLAKKYNARALGMLTVSDSIVAKEPEMTALEREQSLRDMITIALETVCEFI